MNLNEKVALITGGGSAVGRAIAIHFARLGARVVVADNEESAGHEVVETVLASGGDATYSAVDVTDEDQVQSAVGDAIVSYGNLHIVVNAMSWRVAKDALTITREEWDLSLKRNLESAWLCSRYAAPFLKSAGGGALLHLAPTDVYRSMPRRFPYAVSKAGVLALSRNMAIDFGPQGIRSNVLVTGYIQSDHSERWIQGREQPEEAFRRILSAHPLGRVGTPEDVARAAAFLVSDEASFITGSVLVVDGGRSAVVQELHDWS